MMVHDREIGTETSEKAETGKKVHDTITDLITRFLGVPEFNTALGRTFFGRRFPDGGRSSIDDGVLFPKGEFRYRVSYLAEPLRFDPGVIRNYDARIILEITKFDPNLISVGYLYLNTGFIEDQSGKIVAFKHGSIILQDDSGEDRNSATAFDKIPLVFTDFYQPQPIKL